MVANSIHLRVGSVGVVRTCLCTNQMMAELTRDSIAELLEARGVNSDSYCLAGGLPTETYCIDRDGAGWIVYYSERGLRSGLERFDTESEACSRLVAILLTDKSSQH